MGGARSHEGEHRREFVTAVLVSEWVALCGHTNAHVSPCLNCMRDVVWVIMLACT